MGELVDEHPHLRVRRELLVDDDLLALEVAPPVGLGVERQAADRVAELGGEVLERGDEVGVARPGDRLARRLERDRLPVRERIGLETSNTATARKSVRASPVSSPSSSRSVTVIGARMRIARSPLRTQRLRSRKARKPAT